MSEERLICSAAVGKIESRFVCSFSFFEIRNYIWPVTRNVIYHLFVIKCKIILHVSLRDVY